MAETCFNCASPVAERKRVVLVRWRREQVHCSETCVRATLRRRALKRNAILMKAGLAVGVPAALVAGVALLWTHHRAPPRTAIALAWPEAPEWTRRPEPIVFGPPWPPTDAQWTAVFDGARWVFPLPGPARRATAPDPKILGGDPLARCRTDGHCAVDAGGDLWGEHVYAALDGVVERVQGDDARGGRSVRLLHFGGMVYTQYFHLAATPRGLVRGAHVRAGDVIGLLGDTGLDGARAHLAFALSVHPARDLPEVYWDPAPWLEPAALRSPPHGTVAGFVPPVMAGGR